MNPSIYDRVRSRLTGTPAEAYAVRRETARHLAVLEARKAKALARLRESAGLADRLLDPAELLDARMGFSDRTFTPLGTLNDRKGGANRPVLYTELDLRQMRAWSRVLCDVNGFAIGFLDRLVEFVVGTGFVWQVHLRGSASGAVSTGVADRDADGKPDAAPAVSRCQQVLDEWRAANDWGTGCEDREQETCLRWRRDGEVFLRLFRGGPHTRGLPVLRSVEPEQVGPPVGEDPTYGPWSWGIKNDADDADTREAFFVRDANGNGSDGEVVPAARVLHLKANTDRAVKRGIPDFWPVHDDLERCRRLLRNMGEVAAIQAAIAYVRQHAPTTTASQVEDLIEAGADYSARARGVSDRTTQVSWTEPGQIVDMSDKMQFVPGPSSTAYPGFIQVEQAILRGAGSRWGMPEFFSGDASNNNYASILVSGGPFERATVRRQRAFAGFQRDLARRVLQLAHEAGRLSREEVESVDVKVTPPSVAIANKAEDEQVRSTQFQAKVLSPQTWMQQAGLDPKIEAANWAAWRKQFPEQQQQPPPGGGGPGSGGAADENDDDGGGKPGPGGGPTAESAGGGPGSGGADEEDGQADAIAEFLLGAFGDQAEALFGAVYGHHAEATWDAVQHPRGKGGRFIPKHSPEALDAAKGKVKNALAGKPDAAKAKALVEHLSILTTAQIRGLMKEYQISASGKDKAALAAKVADRLGKGRRTADEPKKGEPKKNPKLRKGPPESLANVVKRFGGVDPQSLSFLAHYTGLNHAVEDGISLGIFRRGGNGLDQLADELHNAGHIQVPDGKDRPEFLLDSLKKHVYSRSADMTAEIDRVATEYYKRLEDAHREADESEVAAAVRGGEEVGRSEGETGPLGEVGESPGHGDAHEGEGDVDASFDFGANEPAAAPEPAAKPAADPHQAARDAQAAHAALADANRDLTAKLNGMSGKERGFKKLEAEYEANVAKIRAARAVLDAARERLADHTGHEYAVEVTHPDGRAEELHRHASLHDATTAARAHAPSHFQGDYHVQSGTVVPDEYGEPGNAYLAAGDRGRVSVRRVPRKAKDSGNSPNNPSTAVDKLTTTGDTTPVQPAAPAGDAKGGKPMTATELPKLAGSDKQVEWADRIRASLVTGEGVHPSHAAVNRTVLAGVPDALAGLSSAAEWIDKRNDLLPHLVAGQFGVSAAVADRVVDAVRQAVVTAGADPVRVNPSRFDGLVRQGVVTHERVKELLSRMGVRYGRPSDDAAGGRS